MFCVCNAYMNDTPSSPTRTRGDVAEDVSHTMIHANPAGVLVIGASRRLGATFTHALVESRYRVFLGARNEQQLRAHAESIERSFEMRTEWSRVDLRSADECSTFVAAAESHLGSIDVPINNAGVGSNKSLTERLRDAIVDTLALNLAAAMLLARGVLPRMLARACDRGINHR